MPYIFAPSQTDYAVLNNASLFQRCSHCKTIRDKWHQPFDLASAPKGSPHVSQTLDGLYLASPAFHQRYYAEGWTGLTFRALSCGYFHIMPNRRVHILEDVRDAAPAEAPPGHSSQNRQRAMRVHSIEPCEYCGVARDVLAAGPTIIARGELPVAALEFVGTQLEVGQGDARYFHLIAGDGIHGAHRQKRIRGASFGEPVFYAPWGNRIRSLTGPGEVVSIRAYRDARDQRLRSLRRSPST